MLDSVRSIVGDAHVLVAADERAGYEHDWTGRFGTDALAVVRPADDAQLAAVLAECSRRSVAVIPQGGNTSMVGGSVPRSDAPPAIVLSTRRLTDIGRIDPALRSVEVGAGVTLAGLRAACAPFGLDVGVDLAARDSATIGGMVATNAGGSRVARFGTMAAQVRGVRLATGDGRLVGSLSPLPKASAGFRPEMMAVGAEGSLGIVTRVRLALVPQLRHRSSALCAIADASRLGDLVVHLRRHADLDAAELIGPAAYRLATSRSGVLPMAAGADAYVMVDLAADHEVDEALLELLADAPGVVDIVVPGTAANAAAMKALREELPLAIGEQGKPLKLDVAVPVGCIETLVAAVERCARDRGQGHRLYWFGHLLEGNLHLNLVGGDPTDRTLTDLILREVAGMGGAISAEHGIGVAKAPWLPLVRSAADIALARSVKAAFDPAGIMNPGVLFA